MGFLIDTNILSELQKGERANIGVRTWYSQCNSDELFLSVLVVGEIRQGIERLKRRDPTQAARLEQRLNDVLTLMQGRILAVTENIAQRWGVLNSPDPLPVIDGLLAATALEHGLTLVTRNVRDVQRSGAVLLNPFLDEN
ncbi:MAG: twitching motility protein PilT [Gallionellales bacterium GWA2_60_142]|nr:MAG: twitching motility protein PilT [Gallionellales bacterium GWA2_60_142]HCI13600.1 VapC toxin family PIN domain ribonuclease [Gallionellaceae bacterium]